MNKKCKMEKHIGEYYKTLSYGGIEGKDTETRCFLTEKKARDNARQDTWNSDFTLYEVHINEDMDSNMLIAHSIFLASIGCQREPQTEYYMLCAHDEENNDYRLKASDTPNNLDSMVLKIEQEPNYDYYIIYKVTEDLIDDDHVETYEFFSLLPSRTNKVVKYYALFGVDKYAGEEQIKGFRTLKEVEKHNLTLDNEYTQYKYYEIAAEFKEKEITVTKNLIKQIDNSKKDSKKRKRTK